MHSSCLVAFLWLWNSIFFVSRSINANLGIINSYNCGNYYLPTPYVDDSQKIFVIDLVTVLVN